MPLVIIPCISHPPRYDHPFSLIYAPPHFTKIIATG